MSNLGNEKVRYVFPLFLVLLGPRQHSCGWLACSLTNVPFHRKLTSLSLVIWWKTCYQKELAMQ